MQNPLNTALELMQLLDVLDINLMKGSDIIKHAHAFWAFKLSLSASVVSILCN